MLAIHYKPRRDRRETGTAPVRREGRGGVGARRTSRKATSAGTGDGRGIYFFTSIFVAVIQVLPSFSATSPVTVAGFSPRHVCPNFSSTAFLVM
jgi:hypothetical protein